MKESLWYQVEALYKRLQDEESRFIFRKRLEYNLNNEDIDPILDIAVQNVTIEKGSMLELVYNHKKYQDKEIVLAGATEVLGRLAKFTLEGYGFDKLRAFCDNDKQKQGTTLVQLPVLSVEESCRLYNNAIYLVTVDRYFEEIKEQLCQYGIQEENIYTYKRRSDIYGHQYFDHNIITDQENGVFIDAGSLDLWDSELYLSNYPNAKKVYAFEPDAINYEVCKERLKLIEQAEKIELVNKGLYVSERSVCFNSNGGSSKVSDDGERLVSVTSLDHYMRGKEKVTFIKMDIEGAEMEALEGAREIIKRDKPNLAICIYHKNSDILDILQQILDINADYKLWIRHYSEFRWETVVYAVV